MGLILGKKKGFQLVQNALKVHNYQASLDSSPLLLTPLSERDKNNDTNRDEHFQMLILNLT